MTVNYTVQSGSLDELRCDYSRASYQEVPGEESGAGGGGGYAKIQNKISDLEAD